MAWVIIINYITIVMKNILSNKQDLRVRKLFYGKTWFDIAIMASGDVTQIKRNSIKTMSYKRTE